jgi:hypothetical protein
MKFLTEGIPAIPLKSILKQQSVVSKLGILLVSFVRFLLLSASHFFDKTLVYLSTIVKSVELLSQVVIKTSILRG